MWRPANYLHELQRPRCRISRAVQVGCQVRLCPHGVEIFVLDDQIPQPQILIFKKKKSNKDTCAGNFVVLPSHPRAAHFQLQSKGGTNLSLHICPAAISCDSGLIFRLIESRITLHNKHQAVLLAAQSELSHCTTTAAAALFDRLRLICLRAGRSCIFSLFTLLFLTSLNLSAVCF